MMNAKTMILRWLSAVAICPMLAACGAAPEEQDELGSVGQPVLAATTPSFAYGVNFNSATDNRCSKTSTTQTCLRIAPGSGSANTSQYVIRMGDTALGGFNGAIDSQINRALVDASKLEDGAVGGTAIFNFQHENGCFSSSPTPVGSICIRSVTSHSISHGPAWGAWATLGWNGCHTITTPAGATGTYQICDSAILSYDRNKLRTDVGLYAVSLDQAERELLAHFIGEATGIGSGASGVNSLSSSTIRFSFPTGNDPNFLSPWTKGERCQAQHSNVSISTLTETYNFNCPTD